MQAIRVHEAGGPEVLHLEEVQEPAAREGELLIEVEAIGVNFVEIYYRTGLYPTQCPYTPGTDAAGVVRSVGANVTEFAPGDRVVSQGVRGSYAQMATVQASSAVRIPDGVTSKIAVAGWLQGLTAHYLSHSTYPLKAGDVCLIHAAAGGVGLLLCQMAKNCGAMVIGTASTDEKRQLALAAGADEVIDYLSKDFADEVKRITGGVGVDVVYDSVGDTTFNKSLDALKPRGMMVLFGQSSGPVAPIDPQLLNKKGCLYLTRPSLHRYVATRDELLMRANDLLTWIQRGEIRVRIGAEFPLKKAAEAHEMLTGRLSTGKILLIP